MIRRVSALAAFLLLFAVGSAFAQDVNVEERVSVQGYSYGYGPWRGGGSVYLDEVVEHEATLVFDLIDGQKNELVFRGIATETVADSPEKNASKIQKTVEKVFKKYPPKSK